MSSTPRALREIEFIFSEFDDTIDVLAVSSHVLKRQVEVGGSRVAKHYDTTLIGTPTEQVFVRGS